MQVSLTQKKPTAVVKHGKIGILWRKLQNNNTMSSVDCRYIDEVGCTLNVKS